MSTKNAEPLFFHLIASLRATELIPKQLLDDIADSGNIDYQDCNGRTILMAAVKSGNFDLVSTLLSCGANPNVQDIYGATALGDSYRFSHGLRIPHALLASGAHPLILKDQKQLMKILDEIAKQCPGLVLEVLSTNDINYKSSDGYTALSMLLDENFKRRVSQAWCFNTEAPAIKLLDFGADSNTVCRGGIPVLVMATSCCYNRLTEKLIRAGAVVRREDTSKVIEALIAASSSSGLDGSLIPLLESAGADMTYVNPKTKETIAHLVCKTSVNADLALKILAQNGVDFNHQNWTGQTCLMICCASKQPNANIQTILGIGVDVNIRDIETNTAVTLLSQGNIKYLPDLITHGGNIYHCDAAGLALVEKEWFGCIDISRAQVCPEPYYLVVACREGDLAEVKRYLDIMRTSPHNALSSLNWRVKWKVEGDTEDVVGKTALMHAVESPVNTTWQDCDPIRAATMREIVGLLLDEGADINATDDLRGETALMKATLRKYRDMALFLLERGADWRIRGHPDLRCGGEPVRLNRTQGLVGETALHIAYIRNERSIVCGIIDTHIRDENRGDADNSLRDLLTDVREMLRPVDRSSLWRIMQSRLMWARHRPLLMCLYQHGLRRLIRSQQEHDTETSPRLQAQNESMVAVLQNLDLIRSICAYYICS
jgi:ankyrin repeat protein